MGGDLMGIWIFKILVPKGAGRRGGQGCGGSLLVAGVAVTTRIPAGNILLPARYTANPPVFGAAGPVSCGEIVCVMGKGVMGV